MSQRLPDDELLIGYLHDALDAQQRADFESALRTDAVLRARVAAERRRMTQVQQALNAQLGDLPLPPTLTFDQIAPRVLRRRSYWLGGGSTRPYALVALVGALLILFAVALVTDRPDSAGPAVGTPTPTPTVSVTPTTTPAGTLPANEPSVTPGRLTIPTRTPSAPAATPEPLGVIRSKIIKGSAICESCFHSNT